MKLFTVAVYDRGLVLTFGTNPKEGRMPQRLDQEGLGGKTPRGLAYRLSRLFELKLNPDTKKPYTYQEAADRINAAHHAERLAELAEELRADGCSEEDVAAGVAAAKVRSIITPQYIGQFVSGAKDNPSKLLMEHLAGLFGIDPAYFFEESERSRELDDQLDLLAKLKATGVLPLARAAEGLSAKGLSTALAVITHIAELEGDRSESST